MCGITGFIKKNLNINEMRSIINTMNDRLIHRGPDSSGFWIDPNKGIALGHRRLSIIDLSKTGHQPMESNSGRYVIVFNGEIYNYRSIRRELNDIKLKGNSDTEVILASFEKWGIWDSIPKFVGMFAMAIWDRSEEQLYLVRDRVGEKPLYYGRIQNSIIFASELKAIKKFPGFTGKVDQCALEIYFRYGYIPSPYSIYEGIYKLEPGTILRINSQNGSVIKNSYWSFNNLSENRSTNYFQGSDDEAVEILDHLINNSVKNQMTASDVPVGAYLSGGIDSSTIVSIMQANSRNPIKTFSIGFFESQYNEANYAKAIAKYLGTDHSELYVTFADCLKIVDKLPEFYDEPFSDSSQIPTILVSQLAKNHVKVVLTGDGGDELFGGYDRYYQVQRLWKKISWTPPFLRSLLSKVLKNVPVRTWNYILSPINQSIEKKLPGDRIHKIAAILKAENDREFYRLFISLWKNSSEVIAKSSKSSSSSIINVNSNIDFFHWMMLFDSIYYLPDDILVKVDRASMGLSIESRVPLLDHNIIQFAWSLPLSMKMRNNTGKWILRKVLDRYLPNHLVDRPKKGFSVPIGSWLRGPLKEWSEELLNESRLKSEGYLNSEIVRQKWEEHLSGARNWHHQLWSVLMFQAWLEQK